MISALPASHNHSASPFKNCTTSRLTHSYTNYHDHDISISITFHISTLQPHRNLFSAFSSDRSILVVTNGAVSELTLEFLPNLNMAIFISLALQLGVHFQNFGIDKISVQRGTDENCPCLGIESDWETPKWGGICSLYAPTGFLLAESDWVGKGGKQKHPHTE